MLVSSGTCGPNHPPVGFIELSPSTVKHYLANARSKVGVTTTAQLVWIPGPRLPEAEDLAPPDDEQQSA